ncbi:SpoIID/LytB domain-containing protein [Anaerocolumna xylanovorans]|uniref:Stage II sporulation protein D n=1 Tax=Anaerocolumna xylanovorans DSM 12503 TaxID=1121345 RepID=A0A1M7YD74_9FIRM|nr:SpoIID/LytB domain-containing protein [Anaerocolumna xylanovorans]SHO50541.1 stage II sporulation protein D [Anaerocolumna xylanovorans DSM 12503]
MKKKLWLLGICLAALIIIFAGSVIKKLGTDNKIVQVDTPSREGEVIREEEAVRLLAYLGIEEDKLSGKEEAAKKVTFGKARSYLEAITKTLDIKEKDITDKLSFPLLTQDSDKDMLTLEFLNLYNAVLDSLPKDTVPVKEQDLYILANKEEDGKEILVTDQGDITCKDAVSYQEFYQDGKLEEKKEAASQSFKAEDYMDTRVTALVKGNEIVYIKDISDKETVLSNLWIIEGKATSVKAFINGITKEFQTEYPLSEEMGKAVCDITVKDKKIIKITMKPDTITGKVLSAGKNTIEIQGYGKVSLEDNYRIYKIYDELAMEITNSILVGYSTTEFVVANGKIAAALITAPIKAENIRVLIKTNNYSGIFHDKVVLTANKEFTVTAGKTVKKHKAGDKVTIKVSNQLFKEGRIRVETKGENGKITLLSVLRSGANPKYRGSIEVAKEETGLTIVNELSLEEYLYAVVPSEMPTSYNMEALKAQAVCARSYAYNQLMAGGLSEYGAHVDDSVSYQVYNNLPENEQSILAVKDTYGKVLKYEGNVVNTYYFSTSWGYTASLNDVWAGETSAPYLAGKAQAVYDLVNQKAVYASSFHPDTVDYSAETAFRSFLEKPDYSTYDSEFPWYRWNVTVSKKELTASINQSLRNRYTANPSFILTLTGGSLSDNPVFESRDISSIGELKDIKIAAREKSGIVSKLYLIGTKATISVRNEYNIRSLLAPVSSEIKRADGSTVKDLNLLPSAYICFNKGENSITIKGGGYGHGVGMSQNGAKAMADSGKTFDIILKHYYTGINIGFIY